MDAHALKRSTAESHRDALCRSVDAATRRLRPLDLTYCSSSARDDAHQAGGLGVAEARRLAWLTPTLLTVIAGGISALVAFTWTLLQNVPASHDKMRTEMHEDSEALRLQLQGTSDRIIDKLNGHEATPWHREAGMAIESIKEDLKDVRDDLKSQGDRARSTEGRIIEIQQLLENRDC